MTSSTYVVEESDSTMTSLELLARPTEQLADSSKRTLRTLPRLVASKPSPVRVTTVAGSCGRTLVVKAAIEPTEIL